MVFSRPSALSSFEGGWNRAAALGVRHTVLYSYLRLMGNGSKLTGDMPVVYHVRGSWLSEAAGVRDPASWLGGGLSGAGNMIGSEKVPTVDISHDLSAYPFVKLSSHHIHDYPLYASDIL